jgi:hypothetical protein
LDAKLLEPFMAGAQVCNLLVCTFKYPSILTQKSNFSASSEIHRLGFQQGSRIKQLYYFFFLHLRAFQPFVAHLSWVRLKTILRLRL